ncbi:MAG TPA: hypothetical protein PKW05_13355 [Anaerolineae bacterium]|nr:hypothetical protein [Anaerolineae bacterium]
MVLLEINERDVLVGQPVDEVDRDRGRLLAPQEGAVGYGLHLVHPAEVLPADVAPHDVAALGVYDALLGLSCPLPEDCEVAITVGECAVFDEEAANELPRARGWQRVHCLVSDGGHDGDGLEELGDVRLFDPGESAVGPLHCLERGRDGDEFRGHGTSAWVCQ